MQRGRFLTQVVLGERNNERSHQVNRMELFLFDAEREKSKSLLKRANVLIGNCKIRPKGQILHLPPLFQEDPANNAHTMKITVSGGSFRGDAESRSSQGKSLNDKRHTIWFGDIFVK